MKSLLQENEELTRKLDRLKNMSKKVNKKPMKNYLKPELKQESFSSKQKFENIQSQISYKSQPDYLDLKYWNLYQKKISSEMQGCTFQPKLNQTSQRMIRSQIYVKPQDKAFLAKKKSSERVITERAAEQSPKMHKKTKRKPGKKGSKRDIDFYERQIKWLKKKEETRENKRLDKLKNEFSEFKPKPKINKFNKFKVNKKNQEFLERMEEEKLKSKKKQRELQNKFVSNSFKPMINRNYPVRSRVMDSLVKSQVEKIPNFDLKWVNQLN